MSKFKGTKGKSVFDDTDIFSLNESESAPLEFIAMNPIPYQDSNWNANALLVSKAPEMLEVLEEIIKTQLLGGSTIESKIKNLIKKATEL